LESVEEEIDLNMIPTRREKLQGPTVVGRIDLPVEKDHRRKPVASSKGQLETDKKKKRKRIRKDTERVEVKQDSAPKPGTTAAKKEIGKKKKKKLHRPEVNEEDVQRQIKDTLAKLTTKGKSKGSKYRREKRDMASQKMQAEHDRIEEEKNIVKVTEFVSASELATMMNVPVNEVIRVCMSLGLMVSINQRLDAETLSIVADEFNFKVEFVSSDIDEDIAEVEDNEEDMLPRSPIVTVMGHVDHGKTKLLDFIRHTNVIDGEAGGITQHIGAYSVKLENSRRITFLDTPGHEAFTAMRARGAQITDVAIIVIAADDGVMPQTVEAINHAQAANVPLVFAINKIDKPSANPEKIKEELANMNLLVEDWGGKYQSQEISAIKGLNIELLLEKVLLEAELLDLKANPNRKAIGTVIESSLDKGRGFLTTILVETGTLKVGDVILAGSHFGHVKAMFNERGIKITEAAPSTPVLILGLNGAPQAGDRFKVMNNDKEAKEIASRREQLAREQALRTKKHITLDEIGRRIAIGNFKELNVIVKGDVDGSIEALSDSLLKLSNQEIQVSIIHKAVGQISESDILLAAASNAIVVGFQVRPSLSARKIAEKEQIEIRLYSIIYDAIEEIRAAMEGMLSPEIKEEITATLEVLEAFKITKVGTVAGCIVREGKINRNSKVRVIRDGIVVYTGDLGSLKRFKDDAKEVVSGLECGLNIANFNDIKAGDFLEAFKETEIKKKL
jgi:translation initiation factor IF-2